MGHAGNAEIFKEESSKMAARCPSMIGPLGAREIIIAATGCSAFGRARSYAGREPPCAW